MPYSITFGRAMLAPGGMFCKSELVVVDAGGVLVLVMEDFIGGMCTGRKLTYQTHNHIHDLSHANLCWFSQTILIKNSLIIQPVNQTEICNTPSRIPNPETKKKQPHIHRQMINKSQKSYSRLSKVYTERNIEQNKELW